MSKELNRIALTKCKPKKRHKLYVLVYCKHCGQIAGRTTKPKGVDFK